MNIEKIKFDISFFVPCLNEEENIIQTIKAIQYAISKLDLSYEIIIVDDNSKDSTYNIVSKFKKDNPLINIKLIKNKYTKGLGRNFLDTAFIARGKYYMLVNGDNAEPKETLLLILKECGQADIIIPYFGEYDSRNIIRFFISRFFTFLVNIIAGYNIPYYNGPAIHLCYNVMRWCPDTNGFAYQAEIITKTLNEGSTYKTVLIKNKTRLKGKSSAFKMHNILSVIHSLLQIFLRRLTILLFYKNSR